jgi:hypothetical protein
MEEKKKEVLELIDKAVSQGTTAVQFGTVGNKHKRSTAA